RRISPLKAWTYWSDRSWWKKPAFWLLRHWHTNTPNARAGSSGTLATLKKFSNFSVLRARRKCNERRRRAANSRRARTGQDRRRRFRRTRHGWTAASAHDRGRRHARQRKDDFRRAISRAWNPELWRARRIGDIRGIASRYRSQYAQLRMGLREVAEGRPSRCSRRKSSDER